MHSEITISKIISRKVIFIYLQNSVQDIYAYQILIRFKLYYIYFPKFWVRMFQFPSGDVNGSEFLLKLTYITFISKTIPTNTVVPNLLYDQGPF